MSKVCVSVLSLAVAAAMLLGTSASYAIPPFEKEFKEMYYKPDSSDPNEKALAQALDGLGTKMCAACHAPTGSKKVKNAYGAELDKLLDKKLDAKNPTAIQDALKKVAEIKCDPSNPGSPSFGDNLRAGKLPADGAPAVAAK